MTYVSVFQPFCCREPYTSVKVTHGTPCIDPCSESSDVCEDEAT